MSIEAVAWALYEAPMLLTPAGKPDTSARFVLVVFAEHANKTGHNAYPGPARVKFATGLDVRTVERAVRRLENKGLLVRDGLTSMGAVRWRLDLDLKRPASDWAEIEAALKAEREATAARVRKHRGKADVTDSASVTPPSVTDSASVRNALSVRSVTHSAPGEPPVEPPGEPLGGTLPPDPLRTGRASLGRDEDPSTATDVLPDPSTEADQSKSGTPAREATPALDLSTDPNDLSSDELAHLTKTLKAHDPVRFSTTRTAARRALGLPAGVITSPRHRDALNRAIYRAYQAQEVTSSAP
ncbi:helix-turn-helix domain-containing protein [Saccharothrix deserti]|uniref:helix-turn-helix domain-containing protein n=1 Tax=Saccharothrix deserti TaxID=2593674 RepID=UPI00131AECC9|nr:helix-turn-helix domain-containing protein [Saccharothrix deserti]